MADDATDELGSYAQESPLESFKNWILGGQSPLRIANIPSLPERSARYAGGMALDSARALSPVSDSGSPQVPPLAANAWDSIKRVGRTQPTTQDFFNLAPLIFGGAGLAADSEAGGLMANRPFRWGKEAQAHLESPEVSNLSHVDAADNLTQKFGQPYSAENVRYQRKKAGLPSPMGTFDPQSSDLMRSLYAGGKSPGDIAEAVKSQTGRDVDRKSIQNWVDYQKKNGLLSNADTKLGAFSAPATLADYNMSLEKQPGGNPYSQRFILRGADGNNIGHVNVADTGQDLFVNSIAGLGPNTLGPAATRALLRELRTHYPNADSIGGVRISGARAGNNPVLSADGTRYIQDEANLPLVSMKLRSNADDATGSAAVVAYARERLKDKSLSQPQRESWLRTIGQYMPSGSADLFDSANNQGAFSKR